MKGIDFANDRFVVTGGGGFLGKHVTRKLLERGANRNIHLAPHNRHELRNMGDVIRLFQEFDPTVVIHLAARVGGIGANRAQPGTFFYDNMQMGMNVIEACRVFGVKKLLNVGTICSYPKHMPVPFREEHLWNGYPEETNAPYGIAKKALMVMANAYREQYGLNAITVMPTNLYGPGDRFDPETSHVVPALIRKFVEAQEAKREAVEIWGDGEATRDFLYVEDAAEGLLLALEEYNSPIPVNLGTQIQTRIADLAFYVQYAVFGNRAPMLVTFNRNKPNGQPRRSVSNYKALCEFGWAPQTTLQEGLRKTVDWYLNGRSRGE